MVVTRAKKFSQQQQPTGLTIQVIPYVYMEGHDEPQVRRSPRLLTKPNTDRLRYAPPLTGDKAPFKSIIRTRNQKLQEGKRMYSSKIRNLLDFDLRHSREPVLDCNGVEEEELALFVQSLRASYYAGYMTPNSVNLLNEMLPWINLRPQEEEEEEEKQEQEQKQKKGTCYGYFSFLATTFLLLSSTVFLADSCSNNHDCRSTIDNLVNYVNV